ncbi:hypothetical protein B0H13DRAFT_2365334 [Mycena leptocephala]|nr:hypothetical protein B0H13DRAFT_2365334 [Mycena leptocephala]
MAGVGLLFGPMLVGVLLNMILYGAVVTQVDCGVRPIPYYPDSISSAKMYAYYQRFADDPAWIRYFMLYLFIVGFGNVVVECGIIFEPLIIRYGQDSGCGYDIAKATAWRFDYYSLLIAFPSLYTLISLAVNRLNTDPTFCCVANQCSHSVIHLPGAHYIDLPVILCGINMSVKVFRNPEYREFHSFIAAATVWLASSAACDVVIAVGMTHALYKRKTGFGFVDGHINRIIRLALETGALTAITALMDIFLFLGFPRTTMNFIVNFPLSSLYMCSILAMLNFRDRRKATDVEEEHTMPTDIRFQSYRSDQSRVTDPSVDVELRSMSRVTEPFAKPPSCHECLPLPPPPPPVAKKSNFEGSVEIFEAVTEDFGQEIRRLESPASAIKTGGKPASQIGL